jgi:hypothetical protein
VETSLERESEDIATRGALRLEDRVGLCGHGQVALTPEVEGLQGDPDRLVVLVAETELEPA